MAREDDFATRMLADATLVAILTGGVHKASEIGGEGISRETTPTAFDATGYLEPAALVKQRGAIPTGDVYDPMSQHTSVRQIIEIWLYADPSVGYTAIDAALSRLYVLFQGYQFNDTAEIRLANLIDRERDTGALNGASLARQDWQVESVTGS